MLCVLSTTRIGRDLLAYRQHRRRSRTPRDADFDIDLGPGVGEGGQALLRRLFGQWRVIGRPHPAHARTDGHGGQIVVQHQPPVERPAEVGGEVHLSRGRRREVHRTEDGSNRDHGSPTILRGERSAQEGSARLRLGFPQARRPTVYCARLRPRRQGRVGRTVKRPYRLDASGARE